MAYYLLILKYTFELSISNPLTCLLYFQLVRMTDLKTKSEKTRNRLLITASRIFAEKGFQETTIAEICEQAETNIASVNYHFRDKETLYLESWRFAFNQELKLYPPEGVLAADATAEQRLAIRIRSIINRVADDKSYSFAIINKEMAQHISILL